VTSEDQAGTEQHNNAQYLVNYPSHYLPRSINNRFQ